MSLSSRLNLGNLRSYRLRLFLFGLIALTGAIGQWFWRSGVAVRYEEPMAIYDLGQIRSGGWTLRPDGLGGMAIRRDGSNAWHWSERDDIATSYHLALRDSTAFSTQPASNGPLELPPGTMLRKHFAFKFAAYSPASDRIAVGFHDDIRIFDATSHLELARFPMPPLGLSTAAFSWDGNWLAAGDRSSDVFLWNLSDRSGPRILPTTNAAHIAFGANRNELLAIQRSGDCEIWSLTTFQRIGVLPAVSTASYSAAAVSQRGDRLAIGVEDGRIFIWKLNDRTLEVQLDAFRDRILPRLRICFAGFDDSLVAETPVFRRRWIPQSRYPFLRFGYRALTCEFRVWSVGDWRLRRAWQNTVSRALFPDGRRLSFADLSGNTLRLWSLHSSVAKD